MVLNYKECNSNQQLFRKQQYQKRFYCSGKKHRWYASAVYNLFTSTVQYNSNKITACKSGITPGLWEEISTRRFLLFSLEWLKEARDRIKSSYESLGNTDMCLAHKKSVWKLFYIQLKKKKSQEENLPTRGDHEPILWILSHTGRPIHLVETMHGKDKVRNYLAKYS